MLRAKRPYLKEHQMSHQFREIVVSLMRQMGRDFTQCELCPAKIENRRFEVHHTKYEGATFYDLRIVCKKCNRAPENMYLD